MHNGNGGAGKTSKLIVDGSQTSQKNKNYYYNLGKTFILTAKTRDSLKFSTCCIQSVCSMELGHSSHVRYPSEMNTERTLER